MKKTILTFLASFTIFAFASAQSISDGIKFINYERYQSAKQVFQKLIAANPKDPVAIYWLGQAYIAAREIDSAKTIYQNALSSGVNDPWIWIGTGEVEILQGGDVNAAKQRFEQAITSTTTTRGRNKGPNSDILNAIGRAMAAGSSQQGDPNYGIDKLKQAVAIDSKNPDIYDNLALCYLKLGGDHGGEAFEALRQATTLAPQEPRAYYLIGKIYESQRNKESMDEWFSKAIAADATFAPVYLEYFKYYEETDVNTAKEYLDKFVANADQSCANEYYLGDYLFRAGKYQESLDKANEMANGNCKNFARLNVLYAYDYDRLGDSVKAKNYIQNYFAKADTSDIQPADYAFAGNVLAKFPQSGDSAMMYLQKAVTLDTVKQDKIKYLNTAATIAAQSMNYTTQLHLLKRLEDLEGGKLSELEYYNLSDAILNAATSDTTSAFDSSQYLVADSVIAAYVNAYPDKPQGYSFRLRFAKASDKDTSRGLAINPLMEQNAFLAKDTAESAKKSLFANDYYLLIYYAQYATDQPKEEEYRKAIAVTEEMKKLYPDPSSEEYQFADKTGSQIKQSLEKFEKSKNTSGGAGK